MELLTMTSFLVLGIVAIGLQIKASRKKSQEDQVKVKDNHDGQQLLSIQRERYFRLKLRYFAAYFPAVLGDWLQGPYVYKLYASYGFSEGRIALLCLTGFLSSSSLGTFTGPLADKFGRKKLAMVFTVLYSSCCMLKFSTDFWVLMAGRLLGGVATSLFFSVFESWYVRQHRDMDRLPEEWMASTFSQATFANGLIAILAGLLAHFLAEGMELGPRAPFGMAVPCFLICFLVVLLTWQENYGDQTVDLIASYRHGAVLIWKNRPILLLGTIQSIVESCMYVFVFLWTPVLSSPSSGTAPLGLIFSCFMVCIMIGSSIFSIVISSPKSSLSNPASLLKVAAASFCACIAICSASAAPNASKSGLYASFLAFLGLEMAIGVYFPSIGCLRSELIPESHRATVTNWFRVPMNLITCITLLTVNHPDVAADKRSIFAVCTALLVTGTIVAHKFELWYKDYKCVRQQKAHGSTAKTD